MCSPHKGQLTAAGLYKIFTRFPFHRRQANLLRCKVSENLAQKNKLVWIFLPRCILTYQRLVKILRKKPNLFGFFAKMHPNLSKVSEKLAHKNKIVWIFALLNFEIEIDLYANQ